MAWDDIDYLINIDPHMEYIIAPLFLVLMAKTALLGNALRPFHTARPTREEKEQASATCPPQSRDELDAAARQDARMGEIFQPLCTVLSRIESKVDFILSTLDASTENTIRNAPVSSGAPAINQ